ncbi:MAG TPA: hypothetical protein VME21_13315 [Steroidobacteraceae bacterium]|nr:hypothetical protein [Steroidobacteraceae bacterium]
MLPERLRWIDERCRREHRFLARTDHCLYFGQFRAHCGREGGALNRLILDYKRSPGEIARSAGGLGLRRAKERAVDTIARGLRAQFGAAAIETVCTFVPIPTSRLPEDPEHCDRLLRTLVLAFGGLRADIRPLLRLRASTLADHRRGGCRSRLRELLALTQIDERQLSRPLRPLVVLFDDVVTSGKHLRVATQRIRERLPRQAIIAVLVARRAWREPAR